MQQIVAHGIDDRLRDLRAPRTVEVGDGLSEMLALEGMSLRTLADAEAGVDSGPRGSMLKIRWSELVQRITELWAAALGTDAALMEPYEGVAAADDMPHAMAAYLHMRVTTIYGGANEVQRNIIARRALGL